MLINFLSSELLINNYEEKINNTTTMLKQFKHRINILNIWIELLDYDSNNKVLYLLIYKGFINYSEIKNKLGLNPKRVSQLIAHFIGNGIIEQSELNKPDIIYFKHYQNYNDHNIENMHKYIFTDLAKKFFLCSEIRGELEKMILSPIKKYAQNEQKKYDNFIKTYQFLSKKSSFSHINCIGNTTLSKLYQIGIECPADLYLTDYTQLSADTGISISVCQKMYENLKKIDTLYIFNAKKSQKNTKKTQKNNKNDL